MTSPFLYSLHREKSFSLAPNDMRTYVFPYMIVKPRIIKAFQYIVLQAIGQGASMAKPKEILGVMYSLI